MYATDRGSAIILAIIRIGMEMPQKEKSKIKAVHSSEVEQEPRTHRTLGSVSSPLLKKKSYKNRTTIGILLLGINAKEMNSYQRCLLLRACRGTIHEGSGKVLSHKSERWHTIICGNKQTKKIALEDWSRKGVNTRDWEEEEER